MFGRLGVVDLLFMGTGDPKESPPPQPCLIRELQLLFARMEMQQDESGICRICNGSNGPRVDRYIFHAPRKCRSSASGEALGRRPV